MGKSSVRLFTSFVMQAIYVSKYNKKRVPTNYTTHTTLGSIHLLTNLEQ